MSEIRFGLRNHTETSRTELSAGLLRVSNSRPNDYRQPAPRASSASHRAWRGSAWRPHFRDSTSIGNAPRASLHCAKAGKFAARRRAGPTLVAFVGEVVSGVGARPGPLG